MKISIRVLISLIFSMGLLQAAAFDKDVRSRTTKVHLSSNKPLSTGSNILILTIGKDGKPAVDAKVMVKAFMPAMPGMPAMQSKVKAIALGNGKFKARLNLSMGGTWQLHVFIMPSTGKRSRIKTSIGF